MHRIIKVLVYAPDVKKALDEARKVVYEKLKTTRECGAFRYYQDSTGVPSDASVPSDLVESIKDTFPPVLQVSTKRFPTEDHRGMDLVMSAFECMRENFKDNMRKIRCHIANYADDELFDQTHESDDDDFDCLSLYEDPRSFLYICKRLGSQEPEDGYLFDFRGNSITTLDEIEQILDDPDKAFRFYESECHRDLWNQPLWVVPFAVPLPNN